MPSFDAHASQADHNLDILAFFEDQGKRSLFSDWYVTVSFYAALHYLEALIFKIGRFNISFEEGAPISYDGKHAKEFKKHYGIKSEHLARLNLLRDNPEYFLSIGMPFGSLYEMSRTARYDCWRCGEHNHAEARNLLGTIEAGYEDINKALDKGT